ncbi:hypothetical protein [uncultured Herbaspirillum sp.]|uniref:hypothetical protein n=1 Tax=uncultured Herbaspirillum sp. TaxID=160236 RepID=UPI00261CB2A0|nr:hypothetical protein [uncultured Herbaspirillum sp.]
MVAQLELFQRPPARDSRDIAREKAFSIEVEQEILAVFSSRPEEWLSYSDFRELIDKHKIHSWLGHVLHRIAREGKLQTSRLYYGAEWPGDPDYRGFDDRYKWPEGNTK